MTEKEKMLSGLLYRANDEELKKDFFKAKTLIKKYNQTLPNEDRFSILKDLLGSVGEGSSMTPPIYFDYGINTYIGKNFYANTNLVILDVSKIKIGNNVMLGPNVAIYAATHPLDKDLREQGLEFGKEIIIGDDVWIGGNSVINPGVVIGDNVVIGAGSVVTKDIPSNVVAYGNPCKIQKKLK